MRSFNIFVILVLVLKVTFASGHYTMAKLNQSATLNCTSRCSGLMEWIQPRNKHVTVAWCNQTSCRSEEGYEVSHDRYLKDDLSLTITKADYSKRTWYTCQCGGTDVCHVTLRIEPVEFTRRVNPGEPLYLDLPITENVKVTFNKRGDPGSQSPVPVCTVDGRKVHCDSEYKSRASLKSSLTLTEVKKSDIGVYTVQDTDNDEVIATYHVTEPCPDLKQQEGVPVWVVVLKVLLLIAVLVVGSVMHVCLRRENQQLREKAENNGPRLQENGNDMWSYTLLFVLQIFTFAPTVSGDGSVTAKLHHPVTLTCDSRCSGLLKWSHVIKPGSVLARCDQTSCRSEEGFNISHDQYLKGNPHLTITAADYSTRGLYTCLCDDKDVCNVRLLIETLEMTCVIAPGETIDVHLPLTDLVDVKFTASDAVQPSNLQICTVDKEKIQCSPDYKERASLLNTLQIKDGNISDSGNYTVQDIVTEETLAIVTVHVRESSPHIEQQEGVPVLVVVLIVMLLLVVSVFVVLLVMYVRLRREIQQLRENAKNNRVSLLQQNENTENSREDGV